MRILFSFLCCFLLSGCLKTLPFKEGGDIFLDKPVKSVSDNPAPDPVIQPPGMTVSSQDVYKPYRAHTQFKPGPHQVQFSDVEITEAIQVVLVDTLGLTVQFNGVVLDEEELVPLVSFHTSKGVTGPVLFRLFENAVREYGYHISLMGDVAIIQKKNVLSLSGGHGAGFKVYQAKHLTAKKLVDLVRPFLSTKLKLVTEPSSNMIVVSGASFDVDGVFTLFSQFDDDLIQGSHFSIVSLKSNDVKTVVSSLEAIFKFSSVDGVFVNPLPSLNSIMLVASSSHLLDRAKSYLNQLDAYSVSAEPQRYVLKLKSLDVGSVVRMLSKVFVSIEMDSQMKSSEIGIVSNDEGARTTASKKSKESSERGFSKSEKVAYKPLFHAEESTNTLVAYLNRKDWIEVVSLVGKIDRDPLDIQIDAHIVEVVLNSELRRGVQYSLNSGGFTGLLSRAVDGSVSSQLPGAGFSLVGQYGSLVVDALSAVTDVHTLSSPSLIVKHGKQARLSVGDQVPVSTQISEPLEGDDGSRLVTNVDLKDTGIVLNVVPKVDGNNQISLDINMQISQAVVNTTSGIDTPVFQQRSIDTEVSMISGETLVLGGLRSQRQDRGDTGVPGIKDVPLVGNIFGTQKDEGVQTELVLLVTPVLHQQSDTRYEYSLERFKRYEDAVKYFDKRAEG